MRWFAVVLVVLALGAWPAAAGASGWSLEHAANATFPDGIVPSVSCANDAACVAVGSYVNADDYYATLAERWDGSTWSIVPTPNATGAPDSWFNHVACSTASDCVAVGASGNRSDGVDNEHALIEHWDGASWTMEPAPSGTGELLGVACSSPSACTAVGNNVALRWDGTSWSAQALAIPAVGVSTLSSLALTASGSPGAEGHDAVAAVLDARRREVFAAAWRIGAAGEPDRALLEPGAFAPRALAARLPELGHKVLTVGEGAVEFRTQLERSGASVPDGSAELHRVTAVGHCQIARRLEATPADQIVPDYLRPPDAQESPQSRARDEQ